jgi:hypothetical protein
MLLQRVSYNRRDGPHQRGDYVPTRPDAPLVEIDKVPNAVTARTLHKADRGEDLVRSKNAAYLFGQA